MRAMLPPFASDRNDNCKVRLAGRDRGREKEIALQKIDNLSAVQKARREYSRDSSDADCVKDTPL